MKNKFKQIFELRDKEVNIQEQKIAILAKKIKEIKKTISDLTHMINKTLIPKKGTVVDIIRAQGTISILRKEINTYVFEKNRQTSELYKEKETLKAKYIEYEKAKYLFQKEKQEQREYAEKQEQEELDDIGQKYYS